jgi:redox-sensitive bicupin YhaK (pirin superfamily)
MTKAARTIRKQYRAISDDIGDLRTQRPLPNDEIDQIDPFLFLNHHGPQVYPPGNQGLPFGPHPHRGFETVTFIVAGSLVHRDTGGHESEINAGGVQWMTAGRGLEHSELSSDEFKRRGGPLEILQLWINLPSRLKMTEPRYIGLQRDQIPSFDGVHLISGEWQGHRGPIESLTGVTMMTIDARSKITLPAPRGRSVFFYDARAMVLVDFDDDGDTIEYEPQSETLILFGHADPIGEPVVAHGPFVMNTHAEIVQAVRDYQAGKFR